MKPCGSGNRSTQTNTKSASSLRSIGKGVLSSSEAMSAAARRKLSDTEVELEKEEGGEVITRWVKPRGKRKRVEDSYKCNEPNGLLRYLLHLQRLMSYQLDDPGVVG
jgi:hypothetical protein